MVINVNNLKTAGVTIRAFVNGQSYKLPDGATIELFFENGQFPKELHEAINKLLPGQKAEADIIAEHTFRKIHDFQLLTAINNTNEE